MIQYQSTNPLILFIGINPHPGSFKRGVPFSNNKLFWYLLSDAGLIQESRDELRDDASLLSMYKNKFNKVYQFGLVNIIDRPSRNISYLKKGEEKPGNRRLLCIIQEQRPTVVCFVGKITYQKFYGMQKVEYGWQSTIEESEIYVMHTPLRGKAEVRVVELKEVYAHAKKKYPQPSIAMNTTSKNNLWEH